MDRLDEYVASQLASLAKSLSRQSATPRTPTRDGWVALANERAQRTIALSRFIGLHRLGLDRVVEEHDHGRPVGERMLPGIRDRLEQSERSFWRQRLQIRPLLDDIASLFSRGGQYDGDAQPGDGSLQDGSTFSRKTRKFWVPAESELEVMTRLLPHLPLYYFGKRVAKGSKGQRTENDPATTSVYLDAADFSLFRTRLRREDGAVALRLRVYADDSLATVGASAAGQLSNTVWVERKTHREQGESVKERFMVPVAAADALIAAGNGRPVTADELLAHHGQASSGNMEKVQKHRTLATERPSVTTRYLRVCYQYPNDDTVRISLDRDFVMVEEPPLGKSRSGWQWSSDIGAGSKRRHQFPYSVLEIKLRADKKTPPWFTELLDEGLIQDVPKFSKFLHGVSMLRQPPGEELPYWISEVEQFSQNLPRPHDRQLARAPQGSKPVQVHNPVPSPLHGARTPASAVHHRPGVQSSAADGIPFQQPPHLGGYSSPLPQHYSDSGGLDFSTGGMEFEPTGSDAMRSVLCCRRKPHGLGAQLLSDPLGAGPASSAVRLPTAREIRWNRAGAEMYNALQRDPSLSANPKKRKVKIEPKTFMANERTYLSWTTQATNVCVFGVALAGYGEVNDVPWVRAIGVGMLPAGIATLCWALAQYHDRARRFHEKDERSVHDSVAPFILTAFFIALFSLTMVYHQVPLPAITYNDRPDPSEG